MYRRKNFTPQWFYELCLDSRVPEDNYYKKMFTELDLHFIYKSIQKSYSKGVKEFISLALRKLQTSEHINKNI